MCQGFSNFSGLLHHFVLAKLATSSIRVNLPHDATSILWPVPIAELSKH